MTPPHRQRAHSPADPLALLLPVLPILDAFNHRHRNQHRASRWWTSFGLLRRGLGRLVGCLRPHPDVEASVARANWLRSHAVPAAYVAFSQLAADNQHAPLGLLLLAVLGRVHAVLAHLSPPGSPSHPPAQPSKRPPSTAEPAVDHGVVVSRQELLPPEEPVAGRSCHNDSVPARITQQGHGVRAKSTRAKAKERGKKKHRQDALSSLFNSLS